MRWSSILALVLLAACQPLPQPFRPDDKAGAASARLLAPKADASLYVAPIAGPGGDDLADTVAKELREAGIPAFSDQANRYARLLVGERRAGRMVWQVVEPGGRLEHEIAVPLIVGEPSAALARRSARQIDAELRPVVETGTVAGPAVHLAAIEGAPGDGNLALAEALKVELLRRGIGMVEAGPGVPRVRGAVRMLSGGLASEQIVEIRWALDDPDGTEVGSVGQSNTVPRGRLDGVWGNLAWAAAAGGADGVAELLQAWRKAR